MSLIKEITEDYKILLGYENNNKNIYQLLTIDNQIFLQNNTIISLGACEQELKSGNPNQKLILFKIEFYYEDYKIPIIYYKIFTESDLDELDINACKEIPQYLIPVNINENELYKYDLNDSYYKKICNVYTSEKKTDITLYDRKNDYNEKHLTLCEYDCIFLEYNSNTSKVKCQCPQKDIRSQKLNIIYTEKNNFNFYVMKCFNLITSMNNLITNIPFYFISFVIIFLVISFIIFFTKGYKALNKTLEEEIFKKFKRNFNNINKIINNTKKNDKKILFK